MFCVQQTLICVHDPNSRRLQSRYHASEWWYGHENRSEIKLHSCREAFAVSNTSNVVPVVRALPSRAYIWL